MHTQQLLCFVCVADKLNFTKAAEELFLSTPTVTHHIKTLENELGTVLFIRNSKMVRLTESGAQFYQDAQEILARMEIAEKRIRRIASPDTYYLKIGCTSIAEFQVMQYPLDQLRQLHPGIHPQVSVSDIFSLRNLMENGQLDLLFSAKSIKKRHSKSTFLFLKNICNYAIFPRTSPLSHKEIIYYEDIQEERIITLHPKLVPFEYPNRIRDKILNHGLNHLDIHCENDQAGILYASCGYGIAILPEICIKYLPDTLVRRPFEPESFSLEYGVTCPADRQNIYVQNFLDLLISQPMFQPN